MVSGVNKVYFLFVICSFFLLGACQKNMRVSESGSESISEINQILDQSIEQNKNIKPLKVFDIMDNSFPTVNERTPVDVLMSILKHNQAVIILENNKITGIVTKADILGTLGR